MRSPITNKQMVIMQTPFSIKYKGEWVTYLHCCFNCKDTGEDFTTTEIDEENLYRMKLAYELLTTK